MSISFTQRTHLLTQVIEKTQCTHNNIIQTVDTTFTLIHDLLLNCKRNFSSIYTIGNGGSSGIASHHTNDLVNMIGLKAFTFSDSNLITCMANDYGYENVYSRPLDIIAQKNDILIAISSSGKSKNILYAAETATNKGCHVITLSGFESENPLRKIGNINIWTPVSDYGIVESAHFFILHSIVDTLKKDK